MHSCMRNFLMHTSSGKLVALGSSRVANGRPAAASSHCIKVCLLPGCTWPQVGSQAEADAALAVAQQAAQQIMGGFLHLPFARPCRWKRSLCFVLDPS